MRQSGVGSAPGSTSAPESASATAAGSGIIWITTQTANSEAREARAEGREPAAGPGRTTRCGSRRAPRRRGPASGRTSGRRSGNVPAAGAGTSTVAVASEGEEREHAGRVEQRRVRPVIHGAEGEHGRRRRAGRARRGGRADSTRSVARRQHGVRGRRPRPRARDGSRPPPRRGYQNAIRLDRPGRGVVSDSLRARSPSSCFVPLTLVGAAACRRQQGPERVRAGIPLREGPVPGLLRRRRQAHRASSTTRTGTRRRTW